MKHNVQVPSCFQVASSMQVVMVIYSLLETPEYNSKLKIEKHTDALRVTVCIKVMCRIL